jgi:hypothetical protein
MMDTSGEKLHILLILSSIEKVARTPQPFFLQLLQNPDIKLGKDEHLHLHAPLGYDSHS